MEASTGQLRKETTGMSNYSEKVTVPLLSKTSQYHGELRSIDLKFCFVSSEFFQIDERINDQRTES